MSVSVELIPALSDNYIFAIHWDNQAAIIDPAEAAPVQAWLKAHNCELRYILNTHHHADHIDGNDELISEWNCPLIGPKDERIPGVTDPVSEGSVVEVGPLRFEVFDTPAHTSTHVSFYEPNSHLLFAGDTLFAGGCGRIFEGEPKDMWNSLRKLRHLPNDVLLYCGHEYTESNLRFALSVEPDNTRLQKRYQETQALRLAGKPTIPSKLGLEKETNPFLRPDSPAIQRQLDMSGSSELDVFAKLRTMKDSF